MSFQAAPRTGVGERKPHDSYHFGSPFQSYAINEFTVAEGADVLGCPQVYCSLFLFWIMLA